MLFDLLKGKQAHPLSYKIQSLSIDQAVLRSFRRTIIIKKLSWRL